MSIGPRAFLLLVVATALGACLTTSPSGSGDRTVAGSSGVRDDTRMTQLELDQLCMAFGERYLTFVGNATNQVERAADQPAKAARAHTYKLHAASSVYDILTGPNPFAKLMDLILLCELQHHVWGTEGLAAKVFGPMAATPLVEALARGRDDIWGVAALVLKPEQRTVMEEMIREWRVKNPTPEAVAFIRFNDFAAYRGKTILDGVPLGSGLLAPVSEAMRSIEESRLLAERALFLAKRMPLLARWHAESYANGQLNRPEVQALVASANKLADAASALPQDVAKERAIVLAAVEDRSTALGAIARDARAAAEDVRATATDARAFATDLKFVADAAPNLLHEAQVVVTAADALAARVARKPDERPLDLREVSAALVQATTAIAETQALARQGEGLVADARALVHDGEALVASPAWAARLADVDRALASRVDHASDVARALVDVIATRVAALMGLAFVLVVAHRALASWTGRARA